MEGVSTQAGARGTEGCVRGYDETAVRRINEGGDVRVGKTVTHEFAYGQDVPPTRNPWNTNCYPGGSSAGSGVSVSVGSAFAAIGTDTGGSIRIPGSVNGVVGLKPTYGLVSKFGVFPMSPTLDTVGPLARTAMDCALMLGAIAGFDPLDGGSVNEPVQDYAGAVGLGVKGLRLGVDRDYFFYKHLTDDVRTAAEATVDRLAELGAEIVPVRMPELDAVTAVGMTILLADTSEWHHRLLRSHADKYVPATRLMLELGEIVLAAPYVHAQRARAALPRPGVRHQRRVRREPERPRAARREDDQRAGPRHRGVRGGHGREGAGQIGVIVTGESGVANLFAFGGIGAAHLFKVDVRDRLSEGHNGMAGVIARAETTLLFTKECDENDAASRALFQTGKCVGKFDHGNCSASIVIGAVIDAIAVDRFGYTNVIEMRADNHVFILQLWMNARQHANHVFRLRR